MATEHSGREGRCRCGRVAFRVSGEPLVTMACHCQGCQRMTASAYSLSALFPADAFEVVEGEPVIGGMHGAARHYFCGHCMSWMYTWPEGMDEYVNVRPVLIEGAAFSEPFIETQTREKLPWAKTPARFSFEGYPEPGQFPELLAAFAARVR